MGEIDNIRRAPVLVVEDEPVLRLEAIHMVEQAGFEAVSAASVEHAIQLLEQRLDIRIVYMDLDMPRGKKGIEIAKAIRDRWPPIELILIAAFVERKDIVLPERALFYSKPIDWSAITESMNKFSRPAAGRF